MLVMLVLMATHGRSHITCQTHTHTCADASTEKLNMQCLVGIASPDCDVETYLGHRRGGYGFFAAEGTLKVDGDWKGGHGLVGSGLLVAGFERACAC